MSPALLIPNCGWLSPESSCWGTNPRYGPTSRLFRNRSGFSSVNTYANEVSGPTPFTCRNNSVCPYFSRQLFNPLVINPDLITQFLGQTHQRQQRFAYFGGECILHL